MVNRAISGFWRRLCAFGLDCLLLFILAYFPAGLMFKACGPLGLRERLLGFLIALLYFGFFNSSLGKGQTPGKGIMKIEVVDHSGNHIHLGLSLLRFAILGTPWFLNHAPIPFSLVMTPLAYVLGFLLFGLGGAIVYLYIFNRRTRQSLHDLAAGTFVVRTAPKGPVPVVSIWQPHLAVVGVWLLLATGSPFFLSHLSRQGSFPGLLQAAQDIELSGKVRVNSIHDSTTWKITGKSAPPTTWVRVVVTHNTWPGSWETLAATAREIATRVMRNYPEVMQRDLLSLEMAYGYDYGLAWSRQTYSLSYRPGQWQELLENPKKMQEALKYSQKGLHRGIRHYSRALQRNPSDAQAYQRRGVVYYRQGDFDRALADYNRALELNPNDAQAYYDRALAYYRQEDWDQALADASRALDLNPKHTRAYLIRGDAYLEKRDFDQALADFNLALECNPQDDMAYFNRGLAYSKKGDWRRAMEDWSRTLELNPRYANAYYFKAEFLERAGEKKEALEAYQGYLRYAPASAGKYLDEVRERIKALEKE